MRLDKSIDKLLFVLVTLILVLIFGTLYTVGRQKTYADADGEIVLETGEYFVNIYDGADKLVVKSGAITVKEVLERVGVILGEADTVEPSLDSVIDNDNYFINIYRARPVILRDGAVEKYVMASSYDAKTIAKRNGFTIYDGDEVNLVRNTNFLEAGMVEVYEIVRNGGRMVTVEEEIAFSEEIVKDYNLAPGEKEVRQLGEVGLKVLNYDVFYEDGVEVKRELTNEEIRREPVTRIVAVGASEIERTPLTRSKGRNRYTVRKDNGAIVERQETYYDLPMRGVMAIAARECGVEAYYTVRDDGVKVDADGYVLVAANLSYYPRCSVVETSLGLGRVYDTGSFAETNPEQFDLATDWTNRNGQ